MSLQSREPATLIVACVGGHAAERVEHAGEGRVCAVFERSAYVELGGQWICVGGNDLRRGPLNALVDAPGALRRRWIGALTRDTRVLGEWPIFRVADARLDFTRATRWRPTMPALPIDPARLARGLSRMRRAARIRTIPAEGFAFLVAATDADGALADAAHAAESGLHAWLAERGSASPPRALRDVIGLGPGLTPSGDDFLGGALVALHAFGKRDIARTLGDWLLPLCERATHPVSVAHLAAAADGEGGEALHACLTAIADDGDVDLALDTIASVGHTSGWDALAGALTVARA